MLVGLHSSWVEQTAMRHGIPLVAIKYFLQQHLTPAVDPWKLPLKALEEPGNSKERNLAPENVEAKASDEVEKPHC